MMIELHDERRELLESYLYGKGTNNMILWELQNKEL